MLISNFRRLLNVVCFLLGNFILHTYPPMKIGQGVPKRRPTKFRSPEESILGMYAHTRREMIEFSCLFYYLFRLWNTKISNRSKIYSNTKAKFSSITNIRFILS
jgi:hypothetical protein